jgi:hypothetical protein
MRSKLVHWLTSRARGEDGASLIIALVFIVIVASVTAALLPYTSEGGTEATNATSIRSWGNGADGAVEGAIGSIRYNSTAGTTGFPCPSYSAPGYPQPLIATALSVTVTCQALDASGGTGPSDQPQFSILTLDTNTSPATHNVPGLDGLDVQNNFQLVADGGIYSNSNIDTSGPGQPSVFAVGGAAFAAGQCGSVSATGGVDCPRTLSDPVIGDPGYGSVYVHGSLPAGWLNSNADPLGTCANTTSVVTLSPGYYSQPPAADPVSCKNNSKSVWYLSPGGGPDPGVYYFEFPDSSPTWTIPPGTTVVGGTPNGGWTSASSANTVSALPAGTLCDQTRTGVQIVLGGPTSIDVSGLGNSGGRLEVCASKAIESFTGSAQHIALYGLSTGGPRTTTQSPGEVPTTAASAGSPNFLTPSAGERTDGVLATATLGSQQSASLQLGGFPLPADLPGAVVTKAVLKVTHMDGPDPSANLNAPTLAVTLGSGKTVTPQLSQCSTLCTDTTDLAPALQNDANQPVPWRDLEGLSAAYTVTSGKAKGALPAMDSVDGMELDLTYTAPATEAVRCPSDQAPPCYLFLNDKSSTVSFAGTVYTPTGQLQPTVFNTGALLFRRGVIAKDIDVLLSASAKQLAAPFQLPGESSFREVLFKASIGTQVVLEAKVRFDDTIMDNSGNPLLSPGAAVKIEEWTVLP